METRWPKSGLAVCWALALALLVSGTAIAGGPGNGGDQLAAAAKKKCKKGKKCKKKHPAAPASPVAAAPAAPASAPTTPAPPGGGSAGEATFTITGFTGSFDATVTDNSGSCAVTRDAHWTAALGSGADPATFELYFEDEQGSVYVFNASQIPVVVTGSGTRTETCSLPPPGDNGTTTCTFSDMHTTDATVSSDPDATPREPMTIDWYFGYVSPGYDVDDAGVTCMYSGPRPPYPDSADYAPGLFVDPGNDGSSLLEPTGITHVPVATFNGSPTLSISGSGSNSVGDIQLSESWNQSISLARN